MKKLLLLVFSCFCFVLVSAQGINYYMNATYYLPTDQSFIVYSGGYPSLAVIPKGISVLPISAPYLPNIVSHVWLNSSMQVIKDANSNHLNLSLTEYGYSNNSFFRIEYQATEDTGKVHYGFYYFQSTAEPWW